VSSLELPKADIWVMFAILSTVIGYCAKTYFTLSVLLISVLSVSILIDNKVLSIPLSFNSYLLTVFCTSAFCHAETLVLYFECIR